MFDPLASPVVSSTTIPVPIELLTNLIRALIASYTRPHSASSPCRPFVCSYCSNPAHFIRDCTLVIADIRAGVCKRNARGRVVLPSGLYVPHSVTGSNLRARILAFSRTSPRASASAPSSVKLATPVSTPLSPHSIPTPLPLRVPAEPPRPLSFETYRIPAASPANIPGYKPPQKRNFGLPPPSLLPQKIAQPVLDPMRNFHATSAPTSSLPIPQISPAASADCESQHSSNVTTSPPAPPPSSFLATRPTSSLKRVQFVSEPPPSSQPTPAPASSYRTSHEPSTDDTSLDDPITLTPEFLMSLSDESRTKIISFVLSQPRTEPAPDVYTSSILATYSTTSTDIPLGYT